jgi:beta-glucosidase
VGVIDPVFHSQNSSTRRLIREIDAASTVLLKNTGSLPLKIPRSIAIIGSDAAVNPAGPNACADRSCDVGTLAMGWGSGTSEFPVGHII